MKKDCIYRLPCGRCEKRGAPCDAPELEMQTETETETNTFNCNHDWQFECSIINSAGHSEQHRCAKCGETKIMKVIGL